jgi:hypothetical protein
MFMASCNQCGTQTISIVPRIIAMTTLEMYFNNFGGTCPICKNKIEFLFQKPNDLIDFEIILFLVQL